jgi:hypothetical protein
MCVLFGSAVDFALWVAEFILKCLQLDQVLLTDVLLPTVIG